ncbi:cadherin domain-containing protein [Microvirga terricola]|uniref:Cadherin domain-containing protein n=1 Tax=Microvirga terricola TaxID=2719797 RepID=A0ABX0V6J8_9HYPH|nr:cadherin domain-containing protein [Microvirga terricola]NIX75458.1 hypothetical protein [Microvirga terricola]
MAIRTVTFDQLPGGKFVGGGADTLALSGNSTDMFDLTQAEFSGFTTITTDAAFRIKMTGAQFDGITTIEGTWYNRLQIVGSIVDIRGKSISQVWGIDIDPNATVYANELSKLDYVDAFYTKGETLRFFGTLSDADRALAHNSGYDKVVDDTGLETTNPPPVISNLSEEQRLVRPGEIVLLDAASDATVSDDQGTIRRVFVEVKSGFSSDYARIVSTDRLNFIKDSSGDFAIYFDGIKIGNYSKSAYGGYSDLFFGFSDNATQEAVDYILHHIEFVRDSSSIYDSAVTVTVTDKGGLTDSKTVIMKGVDGSGTGGPNHSPLPPIFSTQVVSEGALAGSVIGTVRAFDVDLDALSYSITNNYDGLFRLQENGDLVLTRALDFEQRSTYTFQATASDGRGGVSIASSITFKVSDVIGERVTGTVSAEKILGGKGKDKLSGAGGNDTVGGGVDNDTLTGGTGKDVFVLDTKPNKKTNFDVITDFNVKDDTIYLNDAMFPKLGKGTISKPGKLNKNFFTIGDKAKGANDYLIYNNKTGVLSYDADGLGKGKAVEIAKLSTKLKMTAADFLII